MRQVLFEEPTDVRWRKWRQKCKEATRGQIQALKEGKRAKVTPLYKEQKASVYMNRDGPFRRKCAYCEADITRQAGDIDHYRPANGVTDENRKPVTREGAGGVERHPGYRWLAYSWDNLLPSCSACNRICGQYTEDVVGKWDCFPVESFRAWRPGEEGKEEALLIHPVLDDPAEHLIFNENGVLGWQTPAGELTVRLLGLNENDLPGRRKGRYKAVRDATAQAINSFKNNSSDIGERQEAIEQIKQGYGEFTTYALMAIEAELIAFRDALSRV